MFRFCAGVFVGLVLSIEALLLAASLQNDNSTSAVRYGVQFVCWLVVLSAVISNAWYDGVEKQHEDDCP